MSIIFSYIKQYKFVVVGLLLGLSLFLYGLIQLLSSHNQRENIAFDSSVSDKKVVVSDSNTIVIDVEGAVVRPGVIRIDNNSRVGEAIVRAGTFSNKADKLWIMKHLNLAAKLTDGAKIYIPFSGENYTQSSADSSNIQSTTTNSSLININVADSATLDTLSGIGPVTAQKIIDNRPYGSIEDLVKKKVVSASVFEKIKEKININ